MFGEGDGFILGGVVWEGIGGRLVLVMVVGVVGLYEFLGGGVSRVEVGEKIVIGGEGVVGVGG